MREQIPTARIAGPALERAAAEAKRGLRIATVIGAHLARAALIVLGFGFAGWFATKNSPSTHRPDERVQHIIDTARNLQWHYDAHRAHLWDLMSRVEDIPHGDRGSAAR
ncbi:MAG TPA: hypothetical protein VGO00_12665 [Kofleriaceae bacterium]|jgi:hypothetical protein|nr:hypothetical protein [Kofleriaceae bacterium]